MTLQTREARAAARRALVVLAGLALLLGAAACARRSSPPAETSVTSADPWTREALVRPAELAAQLRGPGTKPTLVHVGFRVLYHQGAIPGTVFAGPASRPDGVHALRAALDSLPRDRALVLYCGCCPWDHCPNVRPAWGVAHAMGFTNVRVLYLGQDLQHDWASQGYPIETPQD